MKMNFADMLGYRADLFFYILSGAISPIVMLLIWLAVYSSGGNVSITRTEMIQYYIFLLVIELWNSAWIAPFIGSEIREGKMSMYFVKPMSVYWYRLFETTSSKIFKSAYLIPIALLLVILLKVSFPSLPLETFVIFILSWLMSALITFTFSFILGASAFWLDDNGSLEAFYNLLFYIFSGKILPLFLFVQEIRDLANILPFRYMLSFPLEILLGKASGVNLLFGFIGQIIWLFLVIIISQIIWKKGVKKYAAFG